MKRVLTTVCLLTVFAFTTRAAPSILRKSGDCKLQVGDAFDNDKVVAVTLENSDVKMTCKFRGGDFFDEFTLFANPSIDNKSGKKIDVSYQVAFFDKAGELIATAGQDGDVDASDTNYQFGSCLRKLPQAEFDKIASYRIVVYVSESRKKG